MAKPLCCSTKALTRVYLAQTGLVGGDFPNHKTPLALVPGDRTLKDGQNELVVRFESPDVGGVKLVKTYTFERGSYAVRVQHDVQNTGTAAVAPQLYMQLVRDGNPPPGESSFYSTFTGPAIYTEAKKYQKVEFKSIENNKVDVERPPPTATWPWCSTISHRPGCWPMASSATCSPARWTTTCMPWA